MDSVIKNYQNILKKDNYSDKLPERISLLVRISTNPGI